MPDPHIRWCNEHQRNEYIAPYGKHETVPADTVDPRLPWQAHPSEDPGVTHSHEIAFDYHWFSISFNATQRAAMLSRLDSAFIARVKCDRPHTSEPPQYAQACTFLLPGNNECLKTSDVQTYIVIPDTRGEWCCERHVVQTFIDMWQQTDSVRTSDLPLQIFAVTNEE